MDSEKKARILVIDDEELICWSLKHSLEKVERYSADIAYSGNNALNKLSNNRYDIVITDLNLPDIKNLELIRKIKELSGNIPVIVISAYFPGTGIEEVMKQGVFKCINKPFEINDVIGDVKEAIEYNIEGAS